MKKQGVAVGRSPGDDVGADRSAGAAFVFDIDLLTQLVAQIVRGQAADDVDGAAGCEWNDEPDRPRRIGIGGMRDAAAREGGERHAGRHRQERPARQAYGPQCRS